MISQQLGTTTYLLGTAQREGLLGVCRRSPREQPQEINNRKEAADISLGTY